MKLGSLAPLLTLAVIVLLSFNVFRGYENHQLEAGAWDIMCQILVDEEFDYDCGEVGPASVFYTELPEGFDGRYFGGGTILISTGTLRVGREGTLVHEFLHYLHEQRGFITIPDEPKKICWSEQEAWWVQQAYDHQDYSNWWIHYRQCWPYYGPVMFRRRGSR